MPVFPLTSAWLKVASAGQAVEIQNLSPRPILVTTGIGVPGALEGLLLDPRESRGVRQVGPRDGRAAAAGPATVAVVGGFSLGASGGVPFAIVLPVISGSAAVGQPLAASTGSWTGSPTGYGYRWERNGSPISGATGAAYTVVNADNGSALAVTVTATNATGSATATSASVGVGSTAPPGGGANALADFPDPNNAYLVAALAA